MVSLARSGSIRPGSAKSSVFSGAAGTLRAGLALTQACRTGLAGAAARTGEIGDLRLGPPRRASRSEKRRRTARRRAPHPPAAGGIAPLARTDGTGTPGALRPERRGVPMDDRLPPDGGSEVREGRTSFGRPREARQVSAGFAVAHRRSGEEAQSPARGPRLLACSTRRQEGEKPPPST